MEISHFLDTMCQIHGEARRRGLFYRTCTDDELKGRTLHLDGRELISFSSCSYLGLEFHPDLIAGVHKAVDAYGTQFSSSRGYVSAPPYEELESQLNQIFNGHSLVTSSTSLGHQSAITALLTEEDAIVMDHQVHYSVQLAARLAQANGATVSLVRHNQLDRAIDEVRRLSRRHQTVWFATDGVFSMYGDLAPINLLREILSIADNVKLYVDDAHGMSWEGKHGCGSFLSRMPMHPRMVLATSLNKAFSAAGGVLVFPTEEMRRHVFDCGGPMVFSGPVQPPMLGAAIASAKLHLSDAITPLQDALRERAQFCNKLMAAHDLPLLGENDSPIFFVRMGLPKVAFEVAERMMNDGLFVNVSAYPSVPMKRAGIRFSITSAHSMADIKCAVDNLAKHVPRVLEDAKLTSDQLDDLFEAAVPEESRHSIRYRPVQISDVVNIEKPKTTIELVQKLECEPTSLTVDRYDTIQTVDRDEWDTMLGQVGSCSWQAQHTAEQIFSNQSDPEHNWTFQYVIVRLPNGKPVAATFFSTAVSKDDMLMRDEISQAVELRRSNDPYFLTSKIVTMGSGFSEGNHLFVDRKGPWRAAMVRLLQVAGEIYESDHANMLLLRDLPADDLEMDSFLREQGFVKVPMFTSHYIDIDWKTDDEYLAKLTRRKRRHLRSIISQAHHFSANIYNQDSNESLNSKQLAHLYRLYRNVADRKRKLNVFPLPANLLGQLQDSPAWEVVTVHLDREGGGPKDGRPVAFYAAHQHSDHYAPFLCGLDYRYVFEKGAYRGMVYQMIQRAKNLGIHRLHMGMDADLEKSRFGSWTRDNCLYIQVRDHFNGKMLREIVAEVGLESQSA